MLKKDFVPWKVRFLELVAGWPADKVKSWRLQKKSDVTGEGSLRHAAGVAIVGMAGRQNPESGGQSIFQYFEFSYLPLECIN